MRAWRSLAWLAVLAALAGCGGGEHDREPFAESQVPPSLGAPYLPPDGWAWGFLAVGEAPVHRYGVSSPPVAPRAQVIILPSYGESAEGWFETVRDLNADGLNVWVLEAAGQGGSERTASPRDLGHVASLDGEPRAVHDFVRVVVRPAPGMPVLLLASGTAAPIGLAAAEMRPFGLTGLVLSDPQALASGSVLQPSLFQFPTSRAPGQRAWRRPDPASLSPRRAAAARWTIANPDLRIGGYSWGYLRAWVRLRQSADEAANLRRVGVPTLVISRAEGPFERACASLRHCRIRALAAADSYPWAADAPRGVWLGEVEAAAGPSPRR